MISQLIVLTILILINAYFAASEIAFISLNDAKIEKQAKEGNKKAKQIEKMLKTPSKFLATIQIGITLAGFLSSAFASETFADKIAPYLYNIIPAISLGVWKSLAIIFITIILSFFTLVFGELVPKRLAMKHYEKISFATIGVIRTISILTAPFVKLLTSVTNGISKIFGVGENEEETVTEEEIKMMLDQGEESGTIKEDEKELINNVFEFNDITVSEIMRHRKDIFAVDINISTEELLEELSKEEYRYSRIPVYDETIDEIKGILYVKDVLKNINKKTFKVKNVIKDAYFISQNRLINEVFRELQKNKKQLAIILDEYGGTAGIVTMEDILEELVGDIYDEYDKEESEYEKISLSMIQDYLKKGIPVMVAWNDWGGHWQVIIGYDTMGTETTQDDVLIVADSYDTTDHNQDGYGIYPAERFYYNWTMYDFFTKNYDVAERDKLFIAVEPEV